MSGAGLPPLDGPEPPVFVYGALRSGTTLFRLMLNAHEGLSNPGEADILFDFLRPDASHPTGWRYDREALAAHRIFKAQGLVLPEGRDGLDLLADLIGQYRALRPGARLTLNLHRHAGRVAQLLPGARIIHLLRDPRDVARSSVGMGWAGISYFGVGHWIETERDWNGAASAIVPDQVLTLRFEDLMTDLEGRLREVCAFLNVPFTPRMLDYHLDTTYGPPDPKVVQQWRRKAAPREIALIEGRAPDLIASRGYALTGPDHPTRSERAWMGARNRLLRWRFNIRRFGLPLFLSAHAARLLRLHRWQTNLRRRMDAKIIAGLK